MCEIYVDDGAGGSLVLRHSDTITNANLHGFTGKPAIGGRSQANWGLSAQARFKNYEAGVTSAAHEYVGTGAGTAGGSVVINIDQEYAGSGIATAGGSAAVTVDNEYVGTGTGTADGTAEIGVSDFSFKWSIDNLEARTDYEFPTVYVDIDKDAMPTGSFPAGEFYERRLLEMPRLQEQELDSRFGITGFQRVTFTVDNSDRLITGFDLQGAFVRMFFVDESGSVYKEFKGRVVDWTLSHQVTINVEDIEALAFTQDLPKRTLNDLIESEKNVLAGQEPELTEFTNSVVADDLGKPIPIIFGRAVKVPLLYVKADGGGREYDYIIGEGIGLNSNNFKEVFTVYRDSAAVSTEVGALDDIEGIIQTVSSTTIGLETNDERPNSWYN